MNIENAYPEYRADFPDELRTQVTDDNVEALDLIGVFDSVSGPVLLDHCHFNDTSYQQIASLLYNGINDSYLNH